MSKKREEEQKIIAEMEQALKERGVETPTEKRARKGAETAETPKKKFGKRDDVTPETIHCKRCQTLMENGVCPTCGYKIYVPMDEEKRKKIRTVLSVVFVAVFVVLFVILQLKK